MKNISKNRARRKHQKYARKIQRPIKRKKRRSVKARFTLQQKTQRSEKLAARKETKRRRKQVEKDKQSTEKIINIRNAMSSIFNSEMLDQLAKTTGFIKRSGGDITAFSFMYIMSFGFLGNGAIALTYLVAGLGKHFNIFVTVQALSKRINTKSSVKFLRAILHKLMVAQLKIKLSTCISQSFSMFSCILLQDSSQITLSESLSESFRGQGGGASKSALKLDFIYDFANFVIHGMKITDATINDQTHSKEILKYVKSGGLVIRDLGYFTINVLKGIQDKGAYYLSRLSISTNVYLNLEDEEPLDVPGYLNKLHKEKKNLSNLKIYVG